MNNEKRDKDQCCAEEKDSCCSGAEEKKSCCCESRSVCSPCLVIWGIVLLGALVFFFLR